MQQQKGGGFRRFAQTPVGKASLIAIAILLTFASYVYVSALVAIPAILLFGLALPIWGGLKRPRYLALSGLVILLIVAPVSSLVITQDIRAPVALASSLTDITGTGGNALMQNASVSPYTGTTSTDFTWQVTIFPQGIPKGNSSPLWLNLYVSTCPGATSNVSVPSWCSAGFPFHLLNYTFAGNLTAPLTRTFNYTIGANGIWDWQMGIYTRNLTTGKLFYQTLVGDPTYNGIEGPVVGDFATTYFALLPTLYLDGFLFLGAPFYVVLVSYMFFKNREARRKQARDRAPESIPPSGGPSDGAAAGSTGPTLSLPPPGGAPSPAVKERTCPNCNAVVYENEANCWKCGASLTSGSTPLPSG